MNSVLTSLAIAAILLLAAGGATAQIYKWVDENGVTNYGNKPPAKVAKVQPVTERISVYSPQKAPEIAQAAPVPMLANRVEDLERQLAAEREARDYAARAEASAAQAAYDQCIAQRRVDCDSALYTYPYAPVAVVAARGRHRPPSNAVLPGLNLAGVTAGNVTMAIRASGGRTIDTPGAGIPDTSFFSPAPSAPRGRFSRGR